MGHRERGGLSVKDNVRTTILPGENIELSGYIIEPEYYIRNYIIGGIRTTILPGDSLKVIKVVSNNTPKSITLKGIKK